MRNGKPHRDTQMTWWERIKWKLWFWNLMGKQREAERIKKHVRKKYCHFGFHKLRHQSYGIGGTGQRMKYVHYLACDFCNYIFFASKNDKKRYENFTKTHNILTKEAISAMINQSSSGVKPKVSDHKGQIINPSVND